jgi:DNA-binding NarL/FixJ family response regulator
VALRVVVAGNYYVTSSLTGHLLQRRARAQALAFERPGLASLTSAERRILTMVAKGKSSKSIAQELFIHHRTVENHRTNICQKLGLQGHSALLRFALQHKGEI